LVCYLRRCWTNISKRCRLSNTYDMHTVLALTFPPAWTDVSLRKLVGAFGGLELTPLVDALGLSSLCVLIATRDTSEEVMPALKMVAPFAPKWVTLTEGVSIRAVLPLDRGDGDAGLGALSQRLARILGGTTRVEVLAPLGYETVEFTANTPDLWLGGGAHGSAAQVSVVYSL
jgi:hypothetical protein